MWLMEILMKNADFFLSFLNITMKTVLSIIKINTFLVNKEKAPFNIFQILINFTAHILSLHLSKNIFGNLIMYPTT